MEKNALLNYKMTRNEDGTYHIEYDYLLDNGKSMHVDAPRVKVNYRMETLIGAADDILFPNIRGNEVLE